MSPFDYPEITNQLTAQGKSKSKTAPILGGRFGAQYAISSV